MGAPIRDVADHGGGGSWGPAAPVGPPPWQPGALGKLLGFVYQFCVIMGTGGAISLKISAHGVMVADAPQKPMNVDFMDF